MAVAMQINATPAMSVDGGRRYIWTYIRSALVECLLPGVRGEVVEPALVGEDEHGDVGVAEHGELARLLGQPAPPLREGHLPAHAVVDPPHLHLPAPAPHLLLPLPRSAR